MADLFDYMDWRGDLSFQDSPANEADYYLISKIGCPNLTDLVPCDEREVPLEETAEAYRARAGSDSASFGIATSPQVLRSFYRLPSVPRFRSLMLSGYRRISDLDNTEQFSALTVRIPDGIRIITFRGTDDNIFAWKENFRMAVTDTIPAQDDALRYLRWAMDAYDGSFIVCGHSKGGNLAVYASSMLPENLQERIIGVYSFDGPGFRDAFLRQEGYLRIFPKLHSLIPQNSIVGLLLSTGKEPEIIKCGCFGAKAHDGFTWEVLGTGFVRSEALSPSSAMFRKAMHETLTGMNLEERTAFIDDFFQIMTSTGAFTLTDLTEIKLRNALEIVQSLSQDEEVHRFASALISNFAADFRRKRAAEGLSSGRKEGRARLFPVVPIKKRFKK